MTRLPSLLDMYLHDIVMRALKEDCAEVGDITSQLLITSDSQGKAYIRAREYGVLAGMPVVKKVLSCVDDTIIFESHISDSHEIHAGDVVATLTGSFRSLLMAERVMLNFLGHMSGIASLTAQYSERLKDMKARLCCTRKTIPLLRLLQKYAVIAGGGYSHRYALHDAILIKDNHIVACGGIELAVKRALEFKGHMQCVEVEIDTLEQLDAILDYPIQAVLLDNMSCDILAKAVAMCQNRFVTEASGNVNIHTVKDIAQTGVDYISIGRLTHSVACLDFGLDM